MFRKSFIVPDGAGSVQNCLTFVSMRLLSFFPSHSFPALLYNH